MVLLIFTTNCSFRSLIHANVAASLVDTPMSSVFSGQVSRIPLFPSSRTFGSTWDHQGRSLHVADSAWYWAIFNWTIWLQEDVVSITAAVVDLVFYSIDFSRQLLSVNDFIPLWIGMETQVVAAAARYVIFWSCCKSCKQ